MQWKNKGHEFDKMANIYKTVDTIAIYGMGKVGKEIDGILKAMQFPEEYKLKYYDQKINAPLIERPVKLLSNGEGTLFVIAVQDSSVQVRIKKLLLSNGYSQNLICTSNEFLEYVLPVFAAYNLNKLYFYSLQVSIGDVCNLSCRDCTNFVPYMKSRRNRDYTEICADIDFLFDKVTYIQYFPLVGGESFLHPDLEKIVKYILTHYGDRLSQLQIYTNGTINKFSNTFLDLLKNHIGKILIYVSNYTYSNPKLLPDFEAFIDVLEQNNIPYFYEENFIWNDSGIRNRKYIEHDNIEQFVSVCSTPCRDYEKGKLFYCTGGKFAAKAFQIEDKNNYLDLKIENDVIKITEFMQGFLENGYLEICKICNGYDQLTNRNIVNAGIQVENGRS